MTWRPGLRRQTPRFPAGSVQAARRRASAHGSPQSSAASGRSKRTLRKRRGAALGCGIPPSGALRTNRKARRALALQDDSSVNAVSGAVNEKIRRFAVWAPVHVPAINGKPAAAAHGVASRPRPGGRPETKAGKGPALPHRSALAGRRGPGTFEETGAFSVGRGAALPTKGGLPPAGRSHGRRRTYIQQGGGGPARSAPFPGNGGRVPVLLAVLGKRVAIRGGICYNNCRAVSAANSRACEIALCPGGHVSG